TRVVLPLANPFCRPEMRERQGAQRRDGLACQEPLAVVIRDGNAKAVRCRLRGRVVASARIAEMLRPRPRSRASFCRCRLLPIAAADKSPRPPPGNVYAASTRTLLADLSGTGPARRPGYRAAVRAACATVWLGGGGAAASFRACHCRLHRCVPLL